MNNATHTKGPWEVTDRFAGSSFMVTSGEVRIVATYRDADTIQEGQQRANAALIAAAPEMLDALKWLHLITNRNNLPYYEQREAYDKIGQLIARAEGMVS